MKRLIAMIAVVVLSGCGAQAMPDDHISELTKRLQPVADDYQLVCQTGAACIEGSGQDPAEYMEMCRRGWRAFQAIKAYQLAYCQLRGLECSEK